MQHTSSIILRTLVLGSFLTVLFTSCELFSKTVAPTPTPIKTTILTTPNVLENKKPSETEFQFYQLLASNPENVNFSPLSLKIAFSLVYPGTADSTQKLFEKIFGFSEANPNPFSKEYELAAKIKDENSSENQLLIENSVWAKNSKEILPEFKESLKLQNAEVSKLSLDGMNEWVSDTTAHKITKIVDKLDPKLKLVIINAIYFKEKWAKPFEAKKTAIEPFQASPNLTQRVNMLHDERHILYYEDSASKWIALPYAKSPFVMYFGLPLKRFDLKSVDEKMNSTYVLSLIHI